VKTGCTDSQDIFLMHGMRDSQRSMIRTAESLAKLRVSGLLQNKIQTQLTTALIVRT